MAVEASCDLSNTWTSAYRTVGAWTKSCPRPKWYSEFLREFGVEPIDANYPGEVAERWRYRDGQGEFGVISSVSHAFCRECTRARLSTEGQLYLCLFANRGHDLRTLLRGNDQQQPASDLQLERRSAAYGARVMIGIPSYGPRRQRVCPKSRCRISAARPGRSMKDVTGLILAGGRGQRMGGVDKGWSMYRGRPLIVSVIERLRPQVGPLLISANRNIERYAELGTVVEDATDRKRRIVCRAIDRRASGLRRAHTEWIAIVPCDTPHVPGDLVRRLQRRIEYRCCCRMCAREWSTRAGIRYRKTTRSADGLAGAIIAGERAVHHWMASINVVAVDFEDAQAFFNINCQLLAYTADAKTASSVAASSQRAAYTAVEKASSR